MVEKIKELKIKKIKSLKDDLEEPRTAVANQNCGSK